MAVPRCTPTVPAAAAMHRPRGRRCRRRPRSLASPVLLLLAATAVGAAALPRLLRHRGSAGSFCTSGLPRPGMRARLPPRLAASGDDYDKLYEAMMKVPDPAERRRERGQYGYPPPETGRNPEAVAEDGIVSLFAIPAVILAAFAATILGTSLRFAMLPPPTVTLNEALTRLIAIEDDYDALGPSIGLRQRVAKWFQWADLYRRVPVELQGLPPGPQRAKAEELGRKAAEFLASVVEYDGYAANSVYGDTGAFADSIAAERAAEGSAQQEEFGAKFLAAGRQALSDAVRTIDDAREDSSLER